MKKPLIVLIQHDGKPAGFDLTRLRPILEPTSYRVEVCTCRKVGQVLPALARTAPDLLILDRPPSPATIHLSGKYPSRILPLSCPQIVLSEERELMNGFPEKADSGEFPIDVVALHERIGRCLVRYPRKHLRISIHLPCFFSSNGLCTIGEILSLGTGGAFIKSACRHVRTGDVLDVGIPLLGMKKELELPARVVYRLEPTQENHYLQGLGVEFLSADRETTRTLHDFLKHTLLDDLYPGFSCWGTGGSQPPVPKDSEESFLLDPSHLHLRN